MAHVKISYDVLARIIDKLEQDGETGKKVDELRTILRLKNFFEGGILLDYSDIDFLEIYLESLDDE